jgi:hypothetical protein
MELQIGLPSLHQPSEIYKTIANTLSVHTELFACALKMSQYDGEILAGMRRPRKWIRHLRSTQTKVQILRPGIHSANQSRSLSGHVDTSVSDFEFRRTE